MSSNWWTDKLGYISAMEEYSAGRRNTLVVFATMRMLHTAQVHLCSTLQAKQRNRNLIRIAKETRVKGEKTDCKGTGGHFLGWWVCSIYWLPWWLYNYTYLLKLTQLHIESDKFFPVKIKLAKGVYCYEATISRNIKGSTLRSGKKIKTMNNKMAITKYLSII